MIELLVVLLLSSMVILAVTMLMVANNKTVSSADNGNRVQENGRFAAAILSRQLRKAGYRDPKDGHIEGMFNLSMTTEGGDDQTDAIAILLDPADNLDCSGGLLPVDLHQAVIVNRFFVGDVEGVNTLMCQSHRSDGGADVMPAVALVAGVDDLQLLYGIRGADDSVSRYVNASSVGGTEAQWREVIAIKIGVLAASGEVEGRGDGRERQYIVLDRPTQTFDDQQARRVFSTTVRLNNSLSRDF